MRKKLTLIIGFSFFIIFLIVFQVSVSLSQPAKGNSIGVYVGVDAAYQIGTDVGNALGKYGGKLDVIYDDGLNVANTAMYGQLIFWNGTIRSSLK